MDGVDDGHGTQGGQRQALGRSAPCIGLLHARMQYRLYPDFPPSCCTSFCRAVCHVPSCCGSCCFVDRRYYGRKLYPNLRATQRAGLSAKRSVSRYSSKLTCGPLSRPPGRSKCSGVRNSGGQNFLYTGQTFLCCCLTTCTPGYALLSKVGRAFCRSLQLLSAPSVHRTQTRGLQFISFNPPLRQCMIDLQFWPSPCGCGGKKLHVLKNPRRSRMVKGIMHIAADYAPHAMNTRVPSHLR